MRVRTTATIAGARIPIQIDIGFGDAVTPAPVEIDYPTLLDTQYRIFGPIPSKRWSGEIRAALGGDRAGSV